MSRYPYLPGNVAKHKCKSILEIGVWAGNTAVQMIKASAQIDDNTDNVYYYGFDIFEDFITDSSVGDLKQPPTFNDVNNKLTSTGANIKLFKGNSLDTIPKFVNENPKLQIDLIFIDGGHAWDVIEADWNNIQPLIHDDTVIIFDDYWTPSHAWGCNKLVDSLNRSIWDVIVLPNASPGYNHNVGRSIRVAKVTKKAFVLVVDKNYG